MALTLCEPEHAVAQPPIWRAGRICRPRSG